MNESIALFLQNVRAKHVNKMSPTVSDVANIVIGGVSQGFIGARYVSTDPRRHSLYVCVSSPSILGQQSPWTEECSLCEFGHGVTEGTWDEVLEGVVEQIKAFMTKKEGTHLWDKEERARILLKNYV
jgi:hypothetical protein